MKSCSVENCTKKYKAKGLCYMHYARVGRSGSIERKRPDHGMSYTPEYKAWAEMLYRCNPKAPHNSSDYVKKGRFVCERWLTSFENFYIDMGKKPTPKHSIDRIDNAKGYYPENCRWATNTQQVINRSIFKNNTSGVKGVYWHSRDKKWSASICVNYHLISLGYFIDKEDAIAARKNAEEEYYSPVIGGLICL